MPRTRTTAILALTTTGLLLTAACGDAGGDPADAAAVPGTEVEVADNRFEPANLQVEPGDTVTWTWTGSASHDVAGDGFASEIQRSGSFTHTFDEPGTYEYVCTVHSRMRGQVQVTDA